MLDCLYPLEKRPRSYTSGVSVLETFRTLYLVTILRFKFALENVSFVSLEVFESFGVFDGVLYYFKPILDAYTTWN